LRGTPTTFSSDDLELVFCNLPQGDRLNDAYFSDAIGEFLQGIFVEFTPGLIGIGFNLLDGDFVDGGATLRANALGGDESIKPTT
jgi:hypothetical protein